LEELEQIADVARDDKQAIICLVGEDIHGKPGIAASVFNVIAEAGVNIRMISQGASEINISFVVQEADVPKAVRHLHQHFFPIDQSRRANSDHKQNGTGKPPRQNGRGSSTWQPATENEAGMGIGREARAKRKQHAANL
jgi:aspartate kinase